MTKPRSWSKHQDIVAATSQEALARMVGNLGGNTDPNLTTHRIHSGVEISATLRNQLANGIGYPPIVSCMVGGE